MTAIRYRELWPREAPLLGEIDRAERVDAVYRASNGALTCHPVQQQILSWTRMSEDGIEHVRTGAPTDLVARLQALLGSGDRGQSAWDESQLVGIGSLEPSGVGGHRKVMKLDMLYVSAGYRGRGIGGMLTKMLADQARSLGARELYISATPTRGTVDAYLRMGAEVMEVPDPQLLAAEPEDIHLVLRLA